MDGLFKGGIRVHLVEIESQLLQGDNLVEDEPIVGHILVKFGNGRGIEALGRRDTDTGLGTIMGNNF